MQQKRLLLALFLSTVILLGWSYFFQPRTPPRDASAPQQAAADETPQNSSQPAAPASQSIESAPTTAKTFGEISEDKIQRQSLSVSTPLYEVEIDGRGAVAKSWVIKKNKDTDRPLYSIAGSRDQALDLQLISPVGLERDELPLRLEIGNQQDGSDAGLISKWNDALRNRNFALSGEGLETEGADAGKLHLGINKGGGKKRVEFKMSELGTGLEVIKTLVFDPDSYVVGVEVRASRLGETVPDVKMAIGPSIGDQGVPHYTFYSVAPQGVALAKEKPVRFLAADVNKNKSGPQPGKGYQVVEGPVDWAAVGDTYFAMALVLPKPAPKLEFVSEEFQHTANNEKEERFLITSFVPVPTDGSQMFLYVGPKDHFALDETSQGLSAAVGRPVDLERLIDYGWLGFTRPIAVQLLKAIKFLNDLTGNYGVAIILFTIIIYMLFFPLKWRSTKSMKKAQKHAPRMKELQQKIKELKSNDPRLKELQMEQLRLMKEANPLGGCLPLLIQMPFLIALYSAITISIDFRQAPFLWIRDLSAGDPIHLLPFLMAGSMVVLQLITPAPSADPLQRKMMAVILPVMMLYMLWSAPSGLLLYWLVGNIVGFGQQMLINRLVKSEDDSGPPEKKNEMKTKKTKLRETRVSQA